MSVGRAGGSEHENIGSQIDSERSQAFSKLLSFNRKLFEEVLRAGKSIHKKVRLFLFFEVRFATENCKRHHHISNQQDEEHNASL